MVLSIIIAILSFSFLIIIHEFGHFIAARLCGVKVDEFALGMGPKIISHKGKKTVFSIRAFPIGGFCAMQGESDTDNPGHSEEIKEEINPDESLNNKKPWQRFLILCAGPFMNLLLGMLLLLGMFTCIQGDGFYIPALNSDTTISVLNEDTDKVVLKEGSRIVNLNGWHIYSKMDISSSLMFTNNEDVMVTIKDLDGNTHTYDAKLIPSDTGRPSISNDIELQSTPKTFVSVLNISGKTFMSLSQNVILSLKYLVTGKVSIKTLSGPVGVTKIVADTAKTSIQKTDFSSLCLILSLISINLGLFNLLPIPALDGGHILFIIIEKATKKKVPEKIQNIITATFMVLLLGFMAVVTCSDIFKLFQN